MALRGITVGLLLALVVKVSVAEKVVMVSGLKRTLKVQLAPAVSVDEQVLLMIWKWLMSDSQAALLSPVSVIVPILVNVKISESCVALGMMGGSGNGKV